MKQKILGVIGGLGPLATAQFLELAVQMTQAKTEQDNLDMIVYNFPSIPDRTGYILGSNLKSPLPGLISCANALNRQGVSCIAIPCVTAHYFHREVQNVVPVPVLNVLGETVSLLRAAGVARVGIMATDGTIRSRLLARELELAGINPIIPCAQSQEKLMHLIYRNVKSGKPVELEKFLAVQQELLDCGSQVILLGCTELSLIRRDQPLRGNFLDMMQVLARAAILACGKRLKPEYEDLLKGVKNHAQESQESFGVSGSNSAPCAG